MPWLWIALACLAVGAVVWLGTAGLAHRLHRAGVLDHPGERSSHSVATPRGGGLALIPAVLAAWGLWAVASGGGLPGLWGVVVGSVLLAAVSWLDDLRGLPAAPRLLAQIAAVLIGLGAMTDAGPLFQGLLPLWLDLALTALVWLWFVNLFNFMDGIDGISGVEAVAIGAGLALLALVAGWPAAWLALPLLLAAATLGFLAHNWPPAAIFLGDVGSVPLGYLLGWLLIAAAGEGAWASALILPAYYLADASLTLLRRLGRGETPWRAHRSHFYQAAVQRGLAHGQVSRRLAALDLLLVALAVLAWLWQPWPALLTAALAVAGLLRHFAKGGAGV